MKYLTDSGIPNKTDIAVAIKNWEHYLLAITEHEFQFRVCVEFLFCSSVACAVCHSKSVLYKTKLV
jgi:hypothetical protein